jgi:hypothetical protein
LWWSVPSIEEDTAGAPTTMTTAGTASRLVPSGSLSVACARYSGFVGGPALASCQR